MADTQLDNLSGDVTLLKSAFEGFQISLSDKLTPAIRKVVQGVTYFIQNFKKYAPIIAGVATAFGTFAVAINIVGIIRKVGVAVSAFFSSLLAANPIALIIAAVAGLVVALMTLWKNNEDFRNAVIEIWGNIKEAIIQVWEAIQVAWGVAKDFFINLWTAIREAAISVWNTISSVAQVVWGAIQAVWNATVGYFQNIWNTISGIFSAVQSVLEGDFQGAWEAIKGIIDGWADYFQGVWDSIVQVFNDAKSVGSKIVRNILAGIQASWSSLTSWITNKWEAIKKLFHINVTVDTQGSGADGSPGQAIGLDYVPTNRYPALLHRGEAVLTSREADTWRRGEYSRNEQNEDLQAILEILEDIRNNGLDANISGKQIYNAVNGENRKRSRATNYNSLAMA